MGLQLAGLAGLNWLGNAISHAVGVSFPGNLVGMLILLLLLNLLLLLLLNLLLIMKKNKVSLMA